MPDACPVCTSELKKHEAQSGRELFDCPRCGPYALSATALVALPTCLKGSKDTRIKLSHALYKATEHEQGALITRDILESIASNTVLPSLPEQLDNLITWLAKNQSVPGMVIQPSVSAEAAIGVRGKENLGFVCLHAKDAGLVSGAIQRHPIAGYMVGPMQLTFRGWEYYEELQRGSSTSRTAFMAMQFGDPELDAIYRDHFKAAVEATGFTLKRLDEGQPAGLIDDRLRVEIRQSRFLIADLTHHNKGAYWEAG